MVFSLASREKWQLAVSVKDEDPSIKSELNAFAILRRSTY